MTNKEKKLVINQVVSYSHNSIAEQIKETIGDSTANNRTISVNQLVRFLSRKGAPKAQRALAIQLQALYHEEKEVLKVMRLVNNRRTDAYDINELIFVLLNT